MEPSPRSLKFVPKIFLPLYGWKHKLAGKKYPESEMSFRQTIHGGSRSDRGFKVITDQNNRKILVSFDAQSVDKRHTKWLNEVEKRIGLSELRPQPYWGFDDLFHKAGTKLLNCFYIQADVKKIQNTEYYYYNNILILQQFSIAKFIIALQNAYVLIDFDARTGHNHGTKFRLKQNRFPDLYDKAKAIE